MAIRYLKGSWSKFSCGQVISLIENSWCHILQLHPRLPFVETVLSVVLKYWLSGMTVHGSVLSVTHKIEECFSKGFIF